MNTVRNVVSQLIEKGRVEHPFIGVGAQEVDQEIAQLFNLPADRGLLVVRVYEDSGAQSAEMQVEREVVIDGQSYLLGGDFIVEIDGKPVSQSRGSPQGDHGQEGRRRDHGRGVSRRRERSFW